MWKVTNERNEIHLLQKMSILYCVKRDKNTFASNIGDGTPHSVWSWGVIYLTLQC